MRMTPWLSRVPNVAVETCKNVIDPKGNFMYLPE
ncbi:hypothetical protein J2T07_003017 [Luteibacter jiangsuensis]|uniref:Uncharacterized protein n=1 Tax=Luteibacter jiangsuensis TaxID=637577 RepID=A0ABT9T0L2_9GAMM|nr:hypothetical protein [Luteibacter jiangsuensis]